MSYSWILPSPAAPAASSGTSTASARPVLAGLLDQEIDPISRDFIDTDDGAWSETADSRSIVLCQLELELGKSYNTPGDGTSIRERLESGDPVTTAFVESEVRRALAILEGLGIIGGLQVNGRDDQGRQLLDEAGRAVFELHYLDLATGSPVDVDYRPLGG